MRSKEVGKGATRREEGDRERRRRRWAGHRGSKEALRLGN